MSLNIKNDEAHRLAVELASLTGESLTMAVTTALRERLARERRPAEERAERLLAIGQRCAARLQRPFDTLDHGDLLYDELGLPK